ncbi:MAG: hypothetical protein Q7V57_02850 [Actinomycetota bacterium]|nr:hypothetical protein [Actinomycetota bacterium]
MPALPTRNVAGTSTTPPESGAATTGEPERTLPDVPVQSGPALVEQGAPPVWAEQPAPVTNADKPPEVKHEWVDPSLLVERPEWRTATRRVYERPDGALQVSDSSMPVNFLDERGEWLPIDNRLRSDGKGGFVNGANAFQVSFTPMRAGGGVQVSAVDGQVGFYALGAAGVAPVLSQDGLSVTYPNVAPGTDLVYTVTGAGVEELLMLRSATSTPTVEFVMSGVGLVRESAGLRGGGKGLASRVRVSNPDTYTEPAGVLHQVL